MRQIGAAELSGPRRARPTRGGFTLLEMLFGIGVIFLLMGIIIAGVHHAGRSAKGAVDLTTIKSLKLGVDHFTQQMGFAPPLVKDFDPQGPLDSSNNDQPLAYQVVDPTDADDLRTIVVNGLDPRFSNFSLPYYILGVLEAPIDGVAGPGFAEVNRDGTFKVKGAGADTKPAGRRFDPFFDVSRKADAVVAIDAEEGRYELRDRGGVPVRYYRWLSDAGPMPANISNYLGTGDPSEARGIRAYLNTPFMVGNPAEDPKLRDASWAIVAAGANGLFGNEHDLPGATITLADMAGRLGLPSDATESEVFAAASADNIVAVGK